MSSSTNNSKIASGDPYVQLEVAKERAKYLEEKVFQQRREREKALTMLRRQEAELKRLEKYCSELCTELEVKKQQLKYTEDKFSEYRQRTAKKNATARIQALLASILFLAASILASLGVNMLTAAYSSALGETMIIISIIVYLIAALITTLFAVEGNKG